MSFVHLHTHSEYSLLDGANRIPDLVQRAVELEMPALALTDHGCLFGAWTFQETARKAGIKPIIGMEAYVAPGDRRFKGRAGEGVKPRGNEGGTAALGEGVGLERERNFYHLVLLARDLEGYRNLVKLASIGYLEGFYYRPRIDREVLQQYSKGLIVSSACLAGEVANHLLAGRTDAARETASWYASLFPDRYYLEVQAHDSPGQHELNAKVFALAAELGLPVVATNDAHFLRSTDHDAHDVLLCIGLQKDRDDPNRMKYDRGLYFKPPAEIAGFFPDHPEVLTNTLAIADTVEVAFRKQYHVPSFPLPSGAKDERTLLHEMTFTRAEARYGKPLPDTIRERLDYELSVISNPKTDYSGYMLITQDFINWAKQRGIPVGPGRGSATGSLVACVLGITDVDPLQFDLLFERFLNPDRVSMPDIDVDFCYERRGEVIEYVRSKYGKDSVGQIITFGTMKARAVIRDVGRVLGFEPAETDKLAKLIPNAPNNSLTVAEAVERVAELRTLRESEPRTRQLLDYAQVLEGLSRHASVHAAGIVIAPGPLDTYVPVCTQPKSAAGDGESESDVLVTQWDMNALEEAGMLKMDFLGLKTLTVIDDAVKAIRRRHGALRDPETGAEYADILALPLDDPAVYEMIARGGTNGVFQFESQLATDKLRSMKCDRFEDLIATNALIRPGPLDSGMTDVYIRRKLGREKVRYPHPLLKDVLESTYGVITYQEQVMRMAQILAGFTLAEADVLRKAVGKKDDELLRREVARFVDRAVEKGVDRGTADDIADQVVTFGRYGFNRSHSVAYALLSYQTAWLKSHYPAEFMAALLSSVVDKTDDVVQYIAECRELSRTVAHRPNGIKVLPPDVNESGWKFTAVGPEEIRFGMGALRGIGAGAVDSILRAREAEGPYHSLFDLVERVDLRLVGRRALEALIQAGACDSFGHRAQLMAGLEVAIRESQLRQIERESGQASLFDLMAPNTADALPRSEPTLPDVPRWSESERLTREKEILGFFISGHPLEKYADIVRIYQDVNTATLKSYRDQKIELACVVTSVTRQLSKRNGAEWARIMVEDFFGTAAILAFSETWDLNQDVLVQDTPLLIRGAVSGRERDEESPPIFLDAATPLSALWGSGQLAVEVTLPHNAEEAVAALGDVFRAHPGSAAVYVRWTPPAAAEESEPGVEVEVGAGGVATVAPPRRRRATQEKPVRFRARAFQVLPSEKLVSELRSVLGADQVRLVRSA
jgi:DNA polymerase III subunit alpha